jgi:hypothetical protein
MKLAWRWRSSWRFSSSPPGRLCWVVNVARAEIPEEIKAAAIADLHLMSPAAVAAKYGLKPTTVRQWKSRELPELVTNVTEKKERIGALMLEYLEASLNALAAQAYVASDPEYINRQPANELAILHGVIADKSVRLVEALHARPIDPPALEGG